MSDVFLTIVNMSITAAVAACAVMAARLLLKRAPKSISFALWAVVLFRAVCPVSFSSPLSFFGSIEGIRHAASGGAINYLPPDFAVQGAMGTDPRPADTGLPTPAASANAAVQAAPALMDVLLTAAAILWIAGVAAMAAYSVISYILLRQRLSAARQLDDNIYETRLTGAPFVCGLLRPQIYLPVALSPADKEYVLAHERTHIRRRDYLIKPLCFLVLAVHWFNPFMWAAWILMSRDMEMSCDEHVIKTLGTQIKTDYSRALLSQANRHNALSATPLAFGESGAKSRIKNVLGYKRPALWVIAASVAACAILYLCFIANPLEAPASVPSESGNMAAQAGSTLPAIAGDNVEIAFHDAGVEAAVRGALGIPDGPVTSADAGRLTQLDLTYRDISNISDLASFTSLESLNLSSAHINDISALAGLTNLSRLDLTDNQISDISALAGLTRLTSLSLYGARISDLSALSAMSVLAELDLSFTDVGDISSLSSLSNLTSLKLYMTPVTDISPLSSLANLRNLDLGENQITDITALSDLTGLTVLNLNGTRITGISALSGLESLTLLSLDNTRVSDITPLSDLKNLIGLNLSQTRVTDISALSGLTRLTDLSLTGNGIVDISALSRLTNLANLFLDSNEIADISPLSGLTNLTGLSISANNISDISALTALTNLNYLAVAQNNIGDLSPISGLKGLITLSLSANNITDLSVLGGLTGLETLYADNNHINSIAALSNLEGLSGLYLSGNRITDIAALSGLKNLSRLDLSHNRITDISVLAGLNALSQIDVSGNDIPDLSVLATLSNLTDTNLNESRSNE